MKKKSNKWFSLLILLLPLLIGIGAVWIIKNNYLENIPGWEEIASKTNPLDALMQLFGGEPSEVRRLRKAEVPERDEGHYEYYFSTLDEDEKRCYREMLDGIRLRDESFYITLSADEEVNHVYKAVLFDHPELYWVHNREHVYRTVYGDSAYCLFTPGYTYSEAETAQIDAAMENAYQEVSEMLPDGPSEYEIIRTVYAYIIENTDYISSEHDQNIAGVFWQKEAVCAGYAGAVQYLLERLGIVCLYVEGDSRGSEEGHAWNIVQINGNYYYLDATNGDQPEFLTGDSASLEEHRTIIYDYLCPFPDEYEATYTPDPEFGIPDCSAADYNFYVMNGACFDSYDYQEIYDLCYLRIDNNAAVIRFKFLQEADFEKACDEWIDGDAGSDVAQYYMRVHGLQRVEYHSGALENFKTIYYIF